MISLALILLRTEKSHTARPNHISGTVIRDTSSHNSCNLTGMPYFVSKKEAPDCWSYLNTTMSSCIHFLYSKTCFTIGSLQLPSSIPLILYIFVQSLSCQFLCIQYICLKFWNHMTFKVVRLLNTFLLLHFFH